MHGGARGASIAPVKTVYVLAGIPGSGKSTVADALRARASRAGAAGAVRSVGSDALRAELAGSESERSHEDLVWTVFFERTAAFVGDPRVQAVILDATFSDAALRRRVVRLVREVGGPDVRIVGVHVDTALAECLRRNAARARRVPEFVLRDMHALLSATPPAVEDGFDIVTRGETWLMSPFAPREDEHVVLTLDVPFTRADG